jgi:PAS domain S-box-containing protein
LVSLFVIAAGVAAVFVAVQADRDARDQAVRDASFAATASAKQLGAFVGTLKATTAQLAANPQIAQVLSTPKGCSLTFAGIGGPDRGHIDIIRADGTVVCSSRKLPSSSAVTLYARSDWFQRALEGTLFVPVATDKATGAATVISAMPIAGGKGVVAGFGDLAAVGPTLASSFGGGRPAEFLVTSANGATALARSIEPRRSVGKSLAGTSFAQVDNTVDRHDLDGVARLYASAPVSGTGWRIYVGEAKAETLASEAQLKRRQIAIVLGGLLLSLLVAWLVYRSVVAPIRRLSRTLRAGRGRAQSVQVPTGGPTEITELAEEINSLVSSIDRELADRLASEARYRDLFENATDLIAVIDRDGRVVNANAALGRALGQDPDALVGQELPALLPPPVETPVYERELVASDGRSIYVEIASRRIEEEGQPLCFEAICRDITERKELEDQLRQSQRLESLGRLAGGVAHDFNNLLTVISGYTEMLIDGRAAEGNELEQIGAAAGRAAKLTRQLLAFSRQQVLQPRVLDINEVVRDLMPMLTRLIGEDIHVIEKLAPAVHPVIADPTQLEQVIVNLVVNARDAMPDGGTLTIETANAQLDHTYLARHPGARIGANAVVTVTDTGSGMDAQTLARAFEPFFSTKPAGAGTGLGLATVHGIVKQSGGSIWAYSEPELGTTFKVYLPLAVDAPSQVPEVHVLDSPAVGTETVLITEDEESLRPLLALMLEEHGYTTIVAGSAREAIEIVERNDAHIDLLLTDLIMPEMNGRELAERIREHHDGIRVLFMSGYAGDTVTRSGALEFDAAFIEKPFSTDDLARKVRETLDHSKTRA